MLRRLLPREEDFFGLFEHHAALTVEGAKEMQRLVQGGQDIHRLITRMDDVMDYIESAASAVMLYELTEMTTPARRLADVLVRSTEAVAVAVAGLRTVKQSKSILEACIEVNRLENEGDEILRGALADLFRGATDPLLVLKWKEVYEALENATDRCEDVANVIEGVVLEHA
jgi:uncharacterized protein Yka (UPF0111/DUF47 family)